MTDTFADRDILRRIPTPHVMHYTATGPVPTAPGDSLSLVGVGELAPVDSPADWPATALGSSVPCALIPAGVYLIATQAVIHPTDPTPDDEVTDADLRHISADATYAYVSPVDMEAVAVMTRHDLTSMVLVATAPVRLYAATHTTTDDAGRTVALDAWITRIGDL